MVLPRCIVREAELRQLRKAATEYEEQNTALRKHVETLQAAVSRLEAETEQQRRHSAALQHHLDSLRDVLANSFAHLPLPGCYHYLIFCLDCTEPPLNINNCTIYEHRLQWNADVADGGQLHGSLALHDSRRISWKRRTHRRRSRHHLALELLRLT